MRNWILLVAIATTVLAFHSSGALAGCPNLSPSKWSSSPSHKTLVKLVLEKYGGDWSGYAAKWERQLDLARDVHARGLFLTLKSKGKLLQVKGVDLENYIKTLSERVIVANCLAETQPAAASITPTAVESNDISYLNTGKRAAEIAGCFKCHNVDGNSKNSTTPHLANQNVGYIVAQLKAFSTTKEQVSGSFGRGHRTNKLMNGTMALLSPKTIGPIAAYFSSLPCSKPDRGIAVPAAPRNEVLCRSCHGPKGINRSSEVPNLAGQRKLYLENQLRSFRLTSSGGKKFAFRKRRHHQIMSGLAATLTNDEMDRLANYYAAQNCRNGADK